MKKVLMVVLAAMMVTLSFTGCVQVDTSKDGGSSASPQQQVTLKVFNVAEYIDKTVISQFETETGIRVVYDDACDSPEDMYAKLKADPNAYDVVFPSDYIANRMISEGMLATLSMEDIPNYSLIDPMYKDLAYDPQNEYTVPYMTGTLGILYNKELVTEAVDSWSIMWDAKYEKNILIWDSVRDAFAMAARKLGKSVNAASEEEIDLEMAELIKQKPLVRAYQSDEIMDSMIGGEAALALVYSGSAYRAVTEAENIELDYIIPKEGSNKWVDTLAIMKNSKNIEAAHKFIDFMCSTDVSLKNQQTQNYTSPQSEVKTKLPEEMQNSHIMYPGKELMDKCESFIYDPTIVDKYNEAWENVKLSR